MDSPAKMMAHGQGEMMMQSPPQPNAAESLVNVLQTEIEKLDKSFKNAHRLLTEEIKNAKIGKLARPGDAAQPEQQQMKDFIDLEDEKPIKVRVMVRIPVKKYPKYNFVGKLLGPGGKTLQQLQEDTFTKMAILGKGVMRDKQKEHEQLMSSDPKYAHLKLEPHVVVDAYAAPSDAHARIGHALAELKKFMVPDQSYDQMQQMSEMNGGPQPLMGGRPPMGYPPSSRGRGMPPGVRGRGAPRGGMGVPRGGAAGGGRGGAPGMRGGSVPRGVSLGSRGSPMPRGRGVARGGAQTRQPQPLSLAVQQQQSYSGAYDDPEYVAGFGGGAAADQSYEESYEQPASYQEYTTTSQEQYYDQTAGQYEAAGYGVVGGGDQWGGPDAASADQWGGAGISAADQWGGSDATSMGRGGAGMGRSPGVTRGTNGRGGGVA
ncbi:PREDICTED: KH domain-containing, RNA-binding, signal transduction-associated protein 3-like, partial [Priapulus caudatus]|uniref:KH domain-containing, RNA-binding, signal transduction-associated protein 3-like n=1 Tax=Priapulus caudatus TaxID=37621 RepID=A0ABM1EID0_PRICU